MTQHKSSKLYFFQLLITILVLTTLSSCITSKKAKIRERKLDTIIATSRSYIGTPYKWGGVNRSGMDCSGLLYVSFKSAGMTIPRTSAEQSKTGGKVKFRKLKKGDLVFFAMGKRRRKITHVGLVTEVRSKNDVRFIHASSSLGVIETNIYTDYYTKKFRKARRYF
ncbi:C40 family peptidase [Marivirga sp. S37H4]|uniref:C40 family peptidase n=2 Tax=Marivirga aurantiaca TaxID=2802615 RepID=A0A934X1G5_9BACT|nr:C40 family peptidase [Marivirga aurantiaca]MBK6266736.1 C40 family peptidase [Marivirga aurantiaca]